MENGIMSRLYKAYLAVKEVLNKISIASANDNIKSVKDIFKKIENSFDDTINHFVKKRQEFLDKEELKGAKRSFLYSEKNKNVETKIFQGIRRTQPAPRLSLFARIKDLALKAFIAGLKWSVESYKKDFRKIENKFIRTKSSLIEDQNKVLDKKITQKEKEIDTFKLNKEFELQKYKDIEAKALKDWHLSIDRNDSSDVQFEKQQALNKAILNKKNFEYEINKELIPQNHKLEENIYKLNKSKYELRVSNDELNKEEPQKHIEVEKVEKVSKPQEQEMDINDSKFNPYKLTVSTPGFEPVNQWKGLNDSFSKDLATDDMFNKIVDSFKIKEDIDKVNPVSKEKSKEIAPQEPKIKFKPNISKDFSGPEL